jgi:uracil-DNA glycosylase
VPAGHATLDELRAAAASCRACDLWERATQTAAVVHPSSILRAPDQSARAAAYGDLVADLRRIVAAVRG